MPTYYPGEPASLLAAVHVRERTVREWFDLLQLQIERAQEFDPDLAAELIAIRDSMRSPDHLPGDMTGRLGALALAAQSLAVSTTNSASASKPRGDDMQLAVAKAVFEAWGGAAMSDDKRRECEFEVAHELNIERRRVTRWFDYFLKH